MVDADPQAQPEDRLTMLRVMAALLVVLAQGAAAAADLELQPKPQNPEERSQPSAPPVQLQTTQPPAAPPKEDQPAVEQKPADTLHPPQAGAPPKDDGWWQKIVREAPNCKTFSDGCRRCDVNYQCSGLPIACQPKEFTCVDPKP
jgi:hypothetical protein